MRKFVFLAITAMSMALLAACGSSEEVTDYVDVSFYGMDTQGSAEYEIDEYSMLQKVLKLDENAHDYPDQETANEAMEISSAYDVKIEPNDNLSNGDKVKVIVTVNADKTKKIKGGEKEVTVEGLDEPEILTTEEAEKNLVLNFNGFSGRGIAQIDNIFDEEPMKFMNFQIENDGELSNGDEATILVDDDFERQLNDGGYLLEDGFNPTFEVKSLDVVAKKATDIKNLADVERFLEEELRNQYKDTDYSIGTNTEYSLKQEKLMYRQFNKDETDSYNYDQQHGNLIGIYTVEKYRVSDEKELTEKFTAIFGFSGLHLDENGKANISEVRQISERKNDTYSVDSVIQLYEGEGYEEVEKK